MSREIDIRQRALSGLRRHAHHLLAAGYALLTPSTYAAWKEPDITGELCKAMEAFMASDDAPRWVVRYALRDDPKLNVPDKHGESRPRIDIELERVQRGKRPKFRFEAKRLGPNHPISGYLGSEGLGAFLSNYYPVNHAEAGMIGYFQQEDVNHWHGQLVKAFADGTSFRLTKSGLAADELAPGLPTWSTTHTTTSELLITIWHTLLRFW